MPKRRNKIIIISDQKCLRDKISEVINFPNIPLSKKEETLSIKETQSPFQKKDSYDDKMLVVLGKDQMSHISQHLI